MQNCHSRKGICEGWKANKREVGILFCRRGFFFYFLTWYCSNLDEPLHVMITAPDMASLKKAEGLVRKLVTPVEENQNEHKRAQLRKVKGKRIDLHVSSRFVCSSWRKSTER